MGLMIPDLASGLYFYLKKIVITKKEKGLRWKASCTQRQSWPGWLSVCSVLQPITVSGLIL